MKEYLVDVPVNINIWIRPDCQRQQFEILKQARPSTMFLLSDGGRNEQEWQAIRENRDMFDNEIDWNCQVYKMYLDKNYGMYGANIKMQELIWSKVDYCIFLEDDQLLSVSAFRFCKELLEKYKDDERICAINTMNHLGRYEDCSADYFFSLRGSIWGIAYYKRTAELFNNFDYGKDAYTMRLLEKQKNMDSHTLRQLKGYAKDKYYGGHIAYEEFFVKEAVYVRHQLQIIPKVNMVTNIGCNANSTHAAELNDLPKGIRRVFNMERHEINFPLKHPQYIIPDTEYVEKRNRIMAVGHPFVKIYRALERAFLQIKNHGLIDGSKEIKHLIQKYSEREK